MKRSKLGNHYHLV